MDRLWRRRISASYNELRNEMDADDLSGNFAIYDHMYAEKEGEKARVRPFVERVDERRKENDATGSKARLDPIRC